MPLNRSGRNPKLINRLGSVRAVKNLKPLFNGEPNRVPAHHDRDLASDGGVSEKEQEGDSDEENIHTKDFFESMPYY